MIPKMDKIEGERVYICGICLEIHDTYAMAEPCCSDKVEKPVDMTNCYAKVQPKTKKQVESLARPHEESYPDKEV